MRIEWWILLFSYVVGIGILFFIPKNKIRLAVVAFLFKQVITFLFGLVVVELELIDYPLRLFASINRSSFTFEYFFFQYYVQFLMCGIQIIGVCLSNGHIMVDLHPY